jgi:hypothetical protein
MRKPINSMPEKGHTAKQLSKAVGCRITVGYLDNHAMSGILLPIEKGNGYRYLTVDRKGVFEIETFDDADQVIHIDESGRRAVLDVIFSSPAEVAAKAELSKPVPPVYILVGGRTITLTEKEARRVYEFLDGPCPLDPLEQRMAAKIGRGLQLPPLPSDRPIRGNFTDKVSESLKPGLTSAE